MVASTMPTRGYCVSGTRAPRAKEKSNRRKNPGRPCSAAQTPTSNATESVKHLLPPCLKGFRPTAGGDETCLKSAVMETGGLLQSTTPAITTRSWLL
nr:uncharacterized protein LOC119162405 isoform X2 [Rhipicephalus microplus]